MFALGKPAALGLGALALSVIGLSGPAWAIPGSNLSSNADTGQVIYATQAINGGTPPGTITIPNTGTGVVYTTAPLTANDTRTGSLTLVFTLPSGVTPIGGATATLANSTGANTPCVATPGQTATLTGVVSGSTITFTVPTTATGVTSDACTVTLNSLTVSGATFLGTATTSSTTAGGGFLITAQTTAVAGNAFTIDQTPLKAALASSENGLVVTPTTNGVAIDVNTAIPANFQGISSPGKVFILAGGDQLVDQYGTVAINSADNAFAANGTTPFSFGTGDTATLTLTGNLTGLASAFFDPANGASNGGLCMVSAAKEAGISGIDPGVISGSTINFSGINFSASPGLVCVYATGTTVLGVNPSGLNVGVSVPANTGIAATHLASLARIGPSRYTQGTPYFLSYSAADPNYAFYVRIVNNAAAPIDVYADVQADNVSVGGTRIESQMAPFTNDLVPVGTIIANAGVSPDSTGRVSMIIFAAPSNEAIGVAGSSAFGPGAVEVSQVLLNPDRTVVPIGGSGPPHGPI